MLTPDRQYSTRAQWDHGPLSVGFQGKYVSNRYISDINDDRLPGFATFDLDASYKIPFAGHAIKFQASVNNIFDRFYITRSTTTATAYGFNVGALHYNGSSPFLYTSAPRTAYFTVEGDF